MDNLNKQEIDVLKYIPQRPPFVMVDKVFEDGPDYIITGFDLKEDNILAENGYFNEGGLVENIAQSAALFAGFQFQAKGKPAPLGYIAGIKDLKIFFRPPCNTEIKTKIRLTNDLMNIQVVEGEVFNKENQKVASCELRIFIKAD
ncbi:MAG: hypothetical protein ACNS60_06010 [Candidatus Cyclobacteriaceae bacterium M2_1C_046]